MKSTAMTHLTCRLYNGVTRARERLIQKSRQMRQGAMTEPTRRPDDGDVPEGTGVVLPQKLDGTTERLAAILARASPPDGNSH